MKLSGHWLGTYQHTWPKEGEIYPLRLQLESRWWGAIWGTMEFDQQGLLLRVQPIRGRLFFRELSFVRDIERYNEQLADSQDSVKRSDELLSPTPTASGPILPSHFWANRVSNQNELGGEWKTLSPCMVGSSRKITQVMFAAGSWSVRRFIEEEG